MEDRPYASRGVVLHVEVVLYEVVLVVGHHAEAMGEVDLLAYLVVLWVVL